MLTKNLKKVLVLSGNVQGASLVAQMIKNLAALQETRVESLGWEDPGEKGMATHSSIVAWSTPWTGEPGRLQPMGSQSQAWLSNQHEIGRRAKHTGLKAQAPRLRPDSFVLLCKKWDFTFKYGFGALWKKKKKARKQERKSASLEMATISWLSHSHVIRPALYSPGATTERLFFSPSIFRVWPLQHLIYKP